MSVHEIKDPKKFKEWISDTKVTLVDFYAEWCGPCKMISPLIEEVAKERHDVNFIKVDVDKFQDLAQEYEILSIPTLIVFKGGVKVKTVTGFITKNEIMKLL